MGTSDDGGHAADHKDRTQGLGTTGVKRFVHDFIEKASALGIGPDVRVPLAVEVTIRRPTTYRINAAVVRERELRLGSVQCWAIIPNRTSFEVGLPTGVTSACLLSEDGYHMVPTISDRPRGGLWKPKDLLRTITWVAEVPRADAVVGSSRDLWGGVHEVRLGDAIIEFLRQRSA